MRIDKKDFIICLGFLCLMVLFFGRFLSGGQIFAYKDLSRYFYPLRHLVVEQARAGLLPLWNPYVFCGFPLLATLQTCFFYPLFLIFYILPYNLAFNYYMILHYFLAACFMYSLLRHFHQGRQASFMGGLVFAFSGYLLSVSNMNTSLSSVIWLPLTLLFYDRLLKRKSYVNVVVLGFLLACHFLGGEPTIIYVTLFLLLAYSAVFSGSFKKLLWDLGALLFSGLIALGLVAVQLLPFLELAGFSNRVVHTAYEIVTNRSFPPREVLTFLFPYFFGDPVHYRNYTQIFLGKAHQDWLISAYLGAIPVFLIAIAFIKKNRFVLFFAGAIVLSLLLAFGEYTPFYRLVYLVPGVSLIRYPVKYLFLTFFASSVLAGVGLQKLLDLLAAPKEGLRGLFKAVRLVFAAALVFLIAGYFLRFRVFYFMIEKYFSKLHPALFELLNQILTFNLLSLVNLVFYLFALLLLLLEASRARIGRPILAFLLITLVALDLLANGYPIMVPAQAEVFATMPENYKIISRDRGMYRFFYTYDLDQQNRSIRGDSFDEGLIDVKDSFAANWPVLHHLFDFYGYASIHPMDFSEYYNELKQDERLKKSLGDLSRFNVKYLAAIKETKLPGLRLLNHKSTYGRDVYLYENLRVLPRAYMLAKDGRPDLKNGRVEIVDYGPNRVELRVEVVRPGRLFISDTHYPGWRACVDGVGAEIEPAEKFFRSVALTPGEHKVEFIYDPLSFKLGAAISLATLCGLVAGGFIYFKKNRA